MRVRFGLSSGLLCLSELLAKTYFFDRLMKIDFRAARIKGLKKKSWKLYAIISIFKKL